MKVFVGISGGVDSAVAAFLLLQKGYEVEGIFMKNWEQDEDLNCNIEEDFASAQQACARLKIKLHTVNFSKEYLAKVFNESLKGYSKGITPNPDILCNKEIKFKLFLDHTLKIGASYLATGHYAKILEKNSDFYLLKGKDQNKDQTYFLYTLNQRILAKTMFPLGDLTKTEVRQIAKDANLPNYDRKDSTGICFIGEKAFKSFLESFLLKKPGAIIDTKGNQIGQHDGLMFYTLGQRSGLKLGGIKGYQEKPWYVLDKEHNSNSLIVGQDQNHPLLYSDCLICSDVNWITYQINQELTCTAKIRYRQVDTPCTVIPEKDGRYKVIFDTKQRAITPGQSIVFYNNNICLGGGIIEEIKRTIL